jgi:hypothetical protein
MYNSIKETEDVKEAEDGDIVKVDSGSKKRLTYKVYFEGKLHDMEFVEGGVQYPNIMEGYEEHPENNYYTLLHLNFLDNYVDMVSLILPLETRFFRMEEDCNDYKLNGKTYYEVGNEEIKIPYETDDGYIKYFDKKITVSFVTEDEYFNCKNCRNEDYTQCTIYQRIVFGHIISDTEVAVIIDKHL